MCEDNPLSDINAEGYCLTLELGPSTVSRGQDPDVGTFQGLPNPVLSTVLNEPNPEMPGIEKLVPKGSSQY